MGKITDIHGKPIPVKVIEECLSAVENDIPRVTVTPRNSLPPFDYLGMEDDFPNDGKTPEEKQKKSMSKTSMNVSLTPQLCEFIKKLIDSGRYESQSEVIREALRLLIQKEKENEAKLANDIRYTL